MAAAPAIPASQAWRARASGSPTPIRASSAAPFRRNSAFGRSSSRASSRVAPWRMQTSTSWSRWPPAVA